MKTYTPSPLNAENITLPDNLTELTEAMARNVHEVWALGRVKEGWKYGETRNDELKTHPDLYHTKSYRTQNENTTGKQPYRH